jgi:glycosyltransferase A (GT-A) superfamily protein (DUF2064 family)
MCFLGSDPMVFIKEPLTENFAANYSGHINAEKLLSIYIETAKKNFSKLNDLKNIRIVPVYRGGGKYPDLRWLSEDDPGFLKQKGENKSQHIKNAVRWALDIGAEKIGIAWLDMFCIDPRQISHAFKMLDAKHLSLGYITNGGCYFMAFDRMYDFILSKIDGENILETLNKTTDNLNASIYLLKEAYLITDDKTYRQWLADTKKNPKHPSSKTKQKYLFKLTAG